MPLSEQFARVLLFCMDIDLRRVATWNVHLGYHLTNSMTRVIQTSQKTPEKERGVPLQPGSRPGRC